MDCPSCSKKLPTLQGMRIHHAKVHDERLANRRCNDCGVEFYDRKAQRKFCDDCNPNGGRNNGNWKDAKDTADCRLCGDTFRYYPSDKRGVYCPSCVRGSGGFLGTPYEEVREIERVIRRCEHCGREMELLKSYVEYDKGHGRFCSQDCRNLAMKEENGAVSYNKGWAALRRRAIERDNKCCQECGVHRSELDFDLDVHHIVPVRDFKRPSEAHTLKNVVCLCRSCHISLEWELRSVGCAPRNE